KLNRFFHGGLWQCEYGLIAEFFFNLRIAHGAVQVSQRLFNEAVQHRAIPEPDFDTSLIFGNGRIALCANSLAYSTDQRVIHSLVSEFRQACCCAGETQRGRMIDGELSFQAASNLAFIAEVQDEWSNAQRYGFDFFWIEPLFLAELDAS